MFGIADGRRRHLGNAHRAPALEHREGRVHRTRHDGWVEPLSIERLLARKIPIDVNRFWRPALPNHRGDLLFSRRINQDEPFTPEAEQILLEHTRREQRGDARVEGVAAL